MAGALRFVVPANMVEDYEGMLRSAIDSNEESDMRIAAYLLNEFHRLKHPEDFEVEEKDDSSKPRKSSSDWNPRPSY